MASFTTRELSGSEVLGRRLHELREQLGLSLEELSQDLQIPAKHLATIESGMYDKLPGLVYARSFVRLYVRRVGLQEAPAMEKFEAEYRLLQAARPGSRPLLAQRVNTEIPWIRRNVRGLIAASIVFIALLFFSWQFVKLFIPPVVTVTEPSKDLQTSKQQIVVRGQTIPGAIVSLNSDVLDVDTLGRFQEQIDLKPGLNTIKISVKTNRSRERVVTRQILYEPAKDTNTNASPPVLSNTNVSTNSNVSVNTNTQ